MSESVAAPASAPVETSAPAGPVSAVPPAEAVVASPAPAPDAAPAPVEAAPAPAAPSVTLLGETPKEPVANPPVEADAQSPEAPKEEGQSEEPAQPIVLDPFELPDGITLDAERVGEFTGKLVDFAKELKADPASIRDFGQNLLNMHMAEVTQAVTAFSQSQLERFESFKSELRQKVEADPQLGGNRLNTTLENANYAIRLFGGSPEQQSELRGALDALGVGNHPALIRLLDNAGAAMREGRPLAAKAPPSAPKSKIATMYGATMRTAS